MVYLHKADIAQNISIILGYDRFWKLLSIDDQRIAAMVVRYNCTKLYVELTACGSINSFISI